jgi:hypothetical protein
VCGVVEYTGFPFEITLNIVFIVPFSRIGFTTCFRASSWFPNADAASNAECPQQAFTCLIMLPVEVLSFLSKNLLILLRHLRVFRQVKTRTFLPALS